ncbi:MAG: hypothetical protein NT009_05940 [Proteobacteria bacterium]|nr:hypothetical protein [Pseudomonadota bacterium]
MAIIDVKPPLWPVKGDKLFKGVPDQNDEIWNGHRDRQWSLYPYGYQKAFQLLGSEALKDDAAKQVLIFPIIFLFRHYIELTLKQIIEIGNPILGKQSKYDPIHKIEELWDQAKKIIIKVYPEGKNEDLSTVDDCMKEIIKKDPKSLVFRYPEDPKKTEVYLPDCGNFDMRNFLEVSEKISNFLEGSLTGIYEYRKNSEE